VRKPMTDTHWKSTPGAGKIDPDKYAGFVYTITHKETGRKYIGKKVYWSKRTEKIKGSTRRRHKRTASDWKKYTGSCKPLNAEIKEQGMDMYDFKIVFQGETRTAINYQEAKRQFMTDCIYSEDYYNDYIHTSRFYGSRK